MKPAFSKQTLFLIISFSLFSCIQKSDTKFSEPKVWKDSLNSKSTSNSNVPLATWISHSDNSTQILELADSSTGIVYYFIKNFIDSRKKHTPYYYKAKCKVKNWSKYSLSVSTDKYNFYYDVWGDTLTLKDEVGVMEKLIRVYNDTVSRNQQ